jgi:hypothetical protein
MIHTKRVIFMILPLLFVPLVYGISSTPDACAAPNAAPNSAKCRTYADSENPSSIISTCCWTEVDAEGIEIEYCQHCDYNPGTGLRYGCGEKHPSGAQQPTPIPPTFGPLAPGVLGDLPTLEQVPTTPSLPPLFGRNEGAVPPTGGIEQPLTSTPFQQGILQGQGQPLLQSETPPTLNPLPTPPPLLPPPTQTGPTNAPQDDLEGGVAEQPQDEEQEDSSEGAETAGPLT